ncbi:TetR/AcrR family transcriptional regulator [Actinocorallia sp. A-T 12471]|uniref:TetR/AcrR family transcriptional regulator n=1 Tax=Actinocorallia sp. A-T 12471 TaxID=3089813 RepID=UPI0029D039F7|nr:TetR/AcrR family transcriptional regulator [Actinocorallia sp. A-T 12471]MDX6740608.1 TetR/AcrR family transcriptional regulator [Actinocorallia sp. A-T 12471]
MSGGPSLERTARGADFLDWVGPALDGRVRAELVELLGRSEPADGRAARSHRSRLAVVEALRELHAAGELRPSADRVAERAGVSRRTVWQQFTDMETLLVEAGRRDIEVLLQLVEPAAEGLPLDERVVWFVRQRAKVFERMTPGWRAARLYQPFSAELRRTRQRTAALARAELETVFGPELGRLAPSARADLVASLQALTLWPFWDSLQVDLGLSGSQATALLIKMVNVQLTAALA